MGEILWLIPFLPLAGFLILTLSGRRLPDKAVAMIGVGSVGLSAVAAFFVVGSFITSPPPGHALTQRVWTWINVGGFKPEVAFYLDSLSAVMTLVVTFVGFLIHLYSSAFMKDDDGYRRFFASLPPCFMIPYHSVFTIKFISLLKFLKAHTRFIFHFVSFF